MKLVIRINIYNQACPIWSYRLKRKGRTVKPKFAPSVYSKKLTSFLGFLEYDRNRAIIEGGWFDAYCLTVSMVGNIVLDAPVFAGQNTGFLLMEDRNSLGKIGLVKSLVSVHES